MTLPSPTLFASVWQGPGDDGAYPTIESFVEDVARILRDEVAELARLGCEYIQLDAPHYPLVLDPAWAGFYAARGWSAADWVAYGVDLDNWVMHGWPGVTFGFHLCKGNQGSRWLVEGGYDSMVDTVLRRVSAHRLLLEYDDARSGGFEPLRRVPGDRTVVLGLVTTKSGRLERQEDLLARIDEAAQHFLREQLALSPQCGFGTSVVGNNLTIDEQNAKLRLVADTAKRAWG